MNGKYLVVIKEKNTLRCVAYFFAFLLKMTAVAIWSKKNKKVIFGDITNKRLLIFLCYKHF